VIVATDVKEILAQSTAPPPTDGNYREAETQGIACAFCRHFRSTGFDLRDEIMVPGGDCSVHDTRVNGVMVCDSFAGHGSEPPVPPPEPPKEEAPNWDFAEQRTAIEVHLADADVREDSGFIVKEILRAGEWPVIPTKGAIVNKPLKIALDGASSKDDGLISLSELVANFRAKAIPNVQIPLSDDEDDHKNTTRVNTGFVRDLWLDGDRLVAKMEFTEPEIKDKVLRGTYADVSCGIPWSVVSQGKRYGAALEHVCITNRPFIDGLGPFLAASEGQPIDVQHFGTAERSSEAETEAKPRAQTSGSPASGDAALDQARRLRELRLAQPTTHVGGPNMPPTGIEALDQLELSDEARVALQGILDENATLRSHNRASDADKRIDELKGLGLQERPGFLTLYRQIFLSDDGGAAVVLLSDSGQEKERLSALQILDRALEALKDSDGKVVLSDQQLVSGNDDPPPPNADGEKEEPVEKRVEAAKQLLYGKK